MFGSASKIFSSRMPANKIKIDFIIKENII
jgi:hypothetical protein